MSKPDTSIIGKVKEIQVWHQRAQFSASDEQVYTTQAAKHFPMLASAYLEQADKLQIAVEALEDVRYSYDRCQDKKLGDRAIDAWDYSVSAARVALSHIIP